MSFGDEVLEAIAIQTLAEQLFDAYNAAGPNPGKTWDGKDVPPFDACGEQVQAKWCAVAVYAMAVFGVDETPPEAGAAHEH